MITISKPDPTHLSPAQRTIADLPTRGAAYVEGPAGSGKTTVVFGITSLRPEAADAKRLAGLSRGHWRIENRLHWVRDVAFGEDASRIRTGQAPQIMTILRNVAIGFLGLLAYDSPTEGLRHFAWNAAEAVDLVTKLPVLAPRTRMKNEGSVPFSVENVCDTCAV